MSLAFLISASFQELRIVAGMANIQLQARRTCVALFTFVDFVDEHCCGSPPFFAIIACVVYGWLINVTVLNAILLYNRPRGLALSFFLQKTFLLTKCCSRDRGLLIGLRRGWDAAFGSRRRNRIFPWLLIGWERLVVERACADTVD